MANKALSYLSATLTQGGADAFAQTTIATALSGQTKTAYLLREICWEFTGVFGFHRADASEISLSLTRKSFAAMPTLLEKAIISKWKRTFGYATSGFAAGDTVIRVPFDADEAPIIVEDPIYAQIDSTATTEVNVVVVRLGYQLVNISEVDRLTLVANSLS